MIGYWHKFRARCEQCGRNCPNIYVVKEPIQGKFCSGFCAREAARQMNEGLTESEISDLRKIHG